MCSSEIVFILLCWLYRYDFVVAPLELELDLKYIIKSFLLLFFCHITIVSTMFTFYIFLLNNANHCKPTYTYPLFSSKIVLKALSWVLFSLKSIFLVFCKSCSLAILIISFLFWGVLTCNRFNLYSRYYSAMELEVILLANLVYFFMIHSLKAFKCIIVFIAT